MDASRFSDAVPRILASPEVCRSCPVIILIAVVFPAPLGPKNPKISPSESVREISFRASSVLYRFETAFSSNTIFWLIIASFQTPGAYHILFLYRKILPEQFLLLPGQRNYRARSFPFMLRDTKQTSPFFIRTSLCFKSSS